MKERPILFSAPMVQAILAGNKTQTRRVMKNQPSIDADGGLLLGSLLHCPYGQVGDQLWVREAWGRLFNDGEPEPVFYRADYTKNDLETQYLPKWKPSIHMPRKASRIQLEITNIRVERLHDISEADAEWEGAPLVLGFDNGKEKHGWQTYIEWFKWLWQSINGTESWNANPWVWVVEFKRIKP